MIAPEHSRPSHAEAALPVPEATALTGASGTKPEGGLAFDLVSVAVSTYAVWVPATKRIVSDASSLRPHIDAYLALLDQGLDLA